MSRMDFDEAAEITFMVNRSKLEELVKLGMSTRQIAVELGKGQTTVRYWLGKYGICVISSKGGRNKVLPEKACLNCNNLLRSKASKSKYCNLNCAAQYQQNAYISQWLSGKVAGQISGGTLISGYIRSYLLSQANYRCSECGWSKVNPFTNKVPLEINHIPE
jgi:hypothetical protein